MWTDILIIRESSSDAVLAGSPTACQENGRTGPLHSPYATCEFSSRELKKLGHKPTVGEGPNFTQGGKAEKIATSRVYFLGHRAKMAPF